MARSASRRRRTGLFAGPNDPLMAIEEVAQWSQHTRGQVRFHIIEGDHFFLTGAAHALLSLLAEELRGTLESI